jgi:hypothetical protein
MNAYEERKQARIERLRERAEKTRAEGESKMTTASQFFYDLNGQPLLPGHYSYKSDRNRRERYDNMGRKGYEMTKQADDLERRAAAAESNRAISSDDPNAPEKLRERIASLEAKQQRMKDTNKIIQRKPKNEPTPEKIAALVTLGASEAAAQKLFEPDFCGRIGFPSYALQNNNANIRRLRQRLAEVEAAAAQREASGGAETTETEYDGFTVCEDVDMNRVQIIFPGKPDESTRSVLKSCGFRWAPSVGAWQRQLNANGRWAAQRVVAQLTTDGAAQ